MIYHIYEKNDDDEGYKDIALIMALIDYAGDTYQYTLTLDKEDMTVSDVWEFAKAEELFDDIRLKDVPRWCRCMADKMRPQIVAQYFQPVIDEWQIRQAETEQTR